MDSSSPPRMNLSSSPVRSSRQKERRLTSITPRRFTRFFTPRASAQSTSSQAQRRRALRTLPDTTVNRSAGHPLLTSSPIHSQSIDEPDGDANESGASRKRRRTSSRGHTASRTDTPSHSSPLCRRLFQDAHTPSASETLDSSDVENDDPHKVIADRGHKLNDIFKSVRAGPRPPRNKLHFNQTMVLQRDLEPFKVAAPRPRRIVRMSNAPFERNLLDREHGLSQFSGRHGMQTPACDYRFSTASFYSGRYDLHNCESLVEPGGMTIPFSLASAHRTPMVAIGDEQGCIRYFDTTPTMDADQPKLIGDSHVHDNAIMDLAFTDDDVRLATACGDRKGKVVDMPTNTVVAELGGGHWDTLRQVAFQSGQAHGDILATSDRAGTIQIWDLRFSPIPVTAFSTGYSSESRRRDVTLDVFQTRSVNRLADTHRRALANSASASVTSIQWLSGDREHLILSGSEANASIKLWDTRYIKRRDTDMDTPIATTKTPGTHSAARPWGITSLSLGLNGSRCYAVCKDSTVYAYSVPHLIMGCAPELERNAWKRRPTDREGLGPLYGFKHDAFRVNSFYVKGAVRSRSQGSDGDEMLAVGSSDGCAVLFPTDERYHGRQWDRQSHQGLSEGSRPPVPLSQCGTALIRGHEREVTTLTWNMDGKLVTASDDYKVRHWQQGDGARHLRTVGEHGGARFMAGWADVADDFDAEED